jgi:hypothetical protein
MEEYPAGGTPRDSPLPAPQVRKVAFDEPSVVMKLLSDESYIGDFIRLLSGFVQVPNAVGDLAWDKRGKAIINNEGLIWLIGNLSRLMNKNLYLSNYPPNRLKSILEVEFRNTSIHLATHLRDYDLRPQDCEYVMGMFRSAAEASFRRPVGDKERIHIYGSVQETVAQSEPNKGKWFGIVPKF